MGFKTCNDKDLGFAQVVPAGRGKRLLTPQRQLLASRAWAIDHEYDCHYDQDKPDWPGP